MPYTWGYRRYCRTRNKWAFTIKPSSDAEHIKKTGLSIRPVVFQKRDKNIANRGIHLDQQGLLAKVEHLIRAD
ncbi:MAG: hypothetical protein JG770_1249 [Mahella sp.]|nr:hypothetical protein [Mahella sp.]MDK2902984.1 hypothetical protein [Clostridiales bacterium]